MTLPYLPQILILPQHFFGLSLGAIWVVDLPFPCSRWMSSLSHRGTLVDQRVLQNSTLFWEGPRRALDNCKRRRNLYRCLRSYRQIEASEYLISLRVLTFCILANPKQWFTNVHQWARHMEVWSISFYFDIWKVPCSPTRHRWSVAKEGLGCTACIPSLSTRRMPE